MKRNIEKAHKNSVLFNNFLIVAQKVPFLSSRGLVSLSYFISGLRRIRLVDRCVNRFNSTTFLLRKVNVNSYGDL